MRVIIQPVNSIVVVDGISRQVLGDMPSALVQWDGQIGRVEHTDRDPEIFYDEQRILPFVEAWEAAAPPSLPDSIAELRRQTEIFQAEAKARRHGAPSKDSA